VLSASVLRKLARWLRWMTGRAGRPAVLSELAVLGGLAEPAVLAEPIVPVELAAAEQTGRLSALRRGRPDLLS